MRSFEILLVADSELVADALSAMLRRAGHRVMTSTTIAGTVENLMRRGPEVDVVMTSTRLGSSLGEDAIQYSRKFATNARLIVLRELAGQVQVDDVERALIRQAIPDRLAATSGWN